jgi:hypothetical protein
VLGNGKSAKMVAVADEITLEFLARKQGSVLEEIAGMRDDLRLWMAMAERLDGTAAALVNELRAERRRR